MLRASHTSVGWLIAACITFVERLFVNVQYFVWSSRCTYLLQECSTLVGYLVAHAPLNTMMSCLIVIMFYPEMVDGIWKKCHGDASFCQKLSAFNVRFPIEKSTDCLILHWPPNYGSATICVNRLFQWRNRFVAFSYVQCVQLKRRVG